MSAWIPKASSGSCDGTFYVYTAGDREYTDDLLYVATDKDTATQSILNKSQKVEGATYSGWVNCGGFIQTSLVYTEYLEPVSVSDPQYVYTDIATQELHLPAQRRGTQLILVLVESRILTIMLNPDISFMMFQ